MEAKRKEGKEIGSREGKRKGNRKDIEK